MATSVQLRAASRALADRAGWLADALDPVARLSNARLWRGPVADRFDDELAEQRRRLSALADDLRLGARLLLIDAEALDGDPVRDILKFGGPS